MGAGVSGVHRHLLLGHQQDEAAVTDRVFDYHGWHVYVQSMPDGNGFYIAVARSNGDPVDEHNITGTEAQAEAYGRAIVDGCRAHGGRVPIYTLGVNGEVRFGW